MRWFLDMCIVLYYIGEGDKERFIKKSQQFVNKKKENKLLLCYYIKDENLPKWVNRQRILFRELIRQINNPSYEPYNSEESKKLYNRDKNKIMKLITFFRKSSNKKEIIDSFESVIMEIEVRINNFLKEKIDEFVIPISDIDIELKSHLLTFLNLGNPIKNDSDAKTLASAIQEHKNKDVIIITADKSEWKEDVLEEVHYHINLKKKYSALPPISYLQDL